MPAPENLSLQTPGAAPAAPEQTAAPAPTSTTQPPADPVFTPLHKGSGRYVVVDSTGEAVGAFKGTKAEAEAEAARLSAGGEPMQPPAAPVHELAEAEAEAAPAAAAAAIDPTTLKQAVLTPEGWVCPAPKEGA